MALRWRRLLLLPPSLFRPLSLRRRCGVAEKETSCFRSVDLPPPAVAEGTSVWNSKGANWYSDAPFDSCFGKQKG
ncbi:hypothetical protein L209DRAFT_748608 [Thermothelomyces heterothallicus CBS 203.75]